MAKRLSSEYFLVMEESGNELYFKSIKTNRKWMLVEVPEDAQNELESCYILFSQLSNGEFVSVKEFQSVEAAIGRIKTIDKSILLKQAS